MVSSGKVLAQKQEIDFVLACSAGVLVRGCTFSYYAAFVDLVSVED